MDNNCDLFSFIRFSTWLNRHAVLTFSKMMSAFEHSYTPSPTSIRTSTVFNVSEWLQPHLNKMYNHSKPHVFKIDKKGSQHAQFFWKKWSSDKVKRHEIL